MSKLYSPEALKLRLHQVWEVVKYQLGRQPSLHGVPFWLSAVLVGLGAVAYSQAFTGSASFATDVARNYPYVFLLLGPLFFGLSVFVVDRFAPAAGGSGIARTLEALEVPVPDTEGKLEQIIGGRVALIIAASSLFALLGGSSMGREGPVVQMGACVFYFVGRKLRNVWPHENHRYWILAGSAAGFAAAFQTPLAGVIFVLEELATIQFQQFKTYVLSAVIISGMMAQWLFGRYLLLGMVRLSSVPLSSVYWAMVVGILCGVGAMIFEWVRVLASRMATSLHLRNRVLIAALMGLIMAAMAIVIDPSSIGGGIPVVSDLLFQHGEFSWRALTVRMLGPIISSLSGCAGGLLAPALSVGALIGSGFSELISYSSPRLLTMLGMAGFLGATTGAPFAALVVVMEMTDTHAANFPHLVSSYIGYGTFTLLLRKWPVSKV